MRAETRDSVWSVLFPHLFYKLTLEGAIVTDLLQSAHSEETEERYQTGWQDRGRHTTSGKGSKLYISKCNDQTEKIFVNIKFLGSFSFFLFFPFFEGMNEMLILWQQKTTGAVCQKTKSPLAWAFQFTVELATDCRSSIWLFSFVFLIIIICQMVFPVIMWTSCSIWFLTRKVTVAEI